MSKWTEVRDNIVEALHVDDVTEQVKQNVTNAILTEVVPMVVNAIDGFVDTLKEQAKNENGWCKLRDGVVLPIVMQGLVYAVKTVLAKTTGATA